MCGLTGFFTAADRTRDTMTAAVERMTATIVHRGPDDAGTFVEENAGVALGFRRLAIVDLSPLGHQPMDSASGRFTMAFNGEFYNHADLRAQLAAAGATFRGTSDTETILAGFEAWGIKATIERCVGMFAFGVWDRERRELTLGRDRLGKKPLFVYAEPGLVSFGSELKTLRAGPAFAAELDRTALVEYLRYLYVPAPRSIYRNVIKLPPGTLLTLRDPRAPLPAPEPYWSMAEVATRGTRDLFDGSDDEAIAAFETLLTDAVAIRMVADVPVGALLSGGIDSSAVVALMQSVSARPVKTYTIGFEERAYDEAHHAEAVARHIGTDHTTLRLTGADALALVPRLPDWFDEPLADPSQLPTYLVCQLARREVIVALTGDGGDELLAGYNRYLIGRRLLGAVARVPRPLRAAVGAVAGLAGGRGGDLRSRAGRIRKAGQVLRAPSVGAAYRSLLSAWQDPGELVPGQPEPPGPFIETIERSSHLSMLGRIMLADQVSYLPDDLLAKIDRASMAVSLESRAPILDHRVAELCWRMPDRFKIRDGQTKWLLRQVLHRRVPRSLVDRPKMGFSVPISAWLRGPLKGWGDDLLSPASLGRLGFLDAPACRAAWDGLQAGQEYRAPALWALLVFLDWHAKWLG